MPEQSRHTTPVRRDAQRGFSLAKWDLGDSITSGLGSNHTSTLSPVQHCAPKLMAIPLLYHSFPILETWPLVISMLAVDPWLQPPCLTLSTTYSSGLSNISLWLMCCIYDKSRQLIKKQRHHITFPTKICIVKAIVFQ